VIGDDLMTFVADRDIAIPSGIIPWPHGCVLCASQGR
jgi:hypothetical protein